MKWVPLKRVARIRYGLGQPPPTAEDGVPILRATNIKRGLISPTNLIRSRVEDLPLSRCPLLEEGEILVVRSGAYTGDSAIVTPEWAGSAPGYDLRVTSFGIAPRFLAYVLLSRPALDHIYDRRQRAAQPHINAEDLAVMPVPLPDPHTQRDIVEALDADVAQIRSLLAVKQELISKLLERRARTILAAATGELTEGEPRQNSSLPWAERLPPSWPVVKLSLVARLGSGHTPSRKIPEYWEDCTIPWITTGEIAQVRDDRREVITETREQISQLGLASSAAEVHPASTVVLCRTASAGFSAIMGAPMATSQDFVTWTCSERLLPRFLLICLRAMRADLLGRLAMGSTHKTIYMPDVQMLRIPLPTVIEQQRALDALDNRLAKIDPLIDMLRSQMSLLEERRRALITESVAGGTSAVTISASLAAA